MDDRQLPGSGFGLHRGSHSCRRRSPLVPHVVQKTENRILGAAALFRGLCRRGEQTIATHPLLAATVICVALFAVFFTLAEPRFDTNDDPGMMFLVQGSDFHEPTEHMVFTNVVIGSTLEWLYSVSSSVNWYSVYLYALHGVAMAALFVALTRKKRIWCGLVAFLVFSLGFELYFLMNLQFTTTAAVVTLSGLLLILHGTSADKRWRVPVMGCLLVVIGGLVRVQAMYPIVLLSVPLFAFTIFRERRWRGPLLVVVAVVLSIGASAFDDWYYHKDAEWREYVEYNDARAALEIQLYTASETAIAGALPSVEWSRNDLRAFQMWFFVDSTVYSKGQLRLLASSLSRLNTGRPVREAIAYLAQCAKESLRFVVLAAVGLAACLATLRRRPWSTALACMALAGGGAGVCGYRALTANLPGRVMIPILATVCIAGVSLALRQSPSTEPTPMQRTWCRWVRALTMLALLAVSACVLADNLERAGAESRGNAASQGLYKTLASDVSHLFDLKGNGALVFVRAGGAFPQEWSSPLWPPSAFLELPDISSGWGAQSPRLKHVFARLEGRSPFEALLSRPDTYLMAAEVLLPVIAVYAEEHYGAAVEFAAVYDGPTELPESSRIHIYKVVTSWTANTER